MMPVNDHWRCVCSGFGGPDHEHSDFEPFSCVDCGCSRHSDASGAEAESHAEPPERAPAVTIPAALNFAQQRITETVSWLDETVAGHPAPTEPDEPLAVCAFADLLEQTWPPNLDPFDVIALCIRRLASEQTTEGPEQTKAWMRMYGRRIGRR